MVVSTGSTGRALDELLPGAGFRSWCTPGLAYDMYLAGPPVPLQRAAFRVLTGAARLWHRA